MTDHSYSNAPQDAAAAIARLIEDIDSASWFAAVGEPATDDEQKEARSYVDGLGFSTARIQWQSDWAAAREAIQRADWAQDWWQKEHQLQMDLYRQAADHLGETVLLHLLSKVTDAATRLLHGPAAVAAARGGVADQGLIRAAAGSASQSCYQMALCRLQKPLAMGSSPPPTDQPFLCKFRLFEAGRWPLSMAVNTLFVF